MLPPMIANTLCTSVDVRSVVLQAARFRQRFRKSDAIDVKGNFGVRAGCAVGDKLLRIGVGAQPEIGGQRWPSRRFQASLRETGMGVGAQPDIGSSGGPPGGFKRAFERRACRKRSRG